MGLFEGRSGGENWALKSRLDVRASYEGWRGSGLRVCVRDIGEPR